MFFGATSIAQVPIGDDASVTRVLATGVGATGTVGVVSLVTDNNLAAGGLVGTGAVGTVAVGVGGGIAVPVGSLTATGSTNDVTPITNVDVNLTGVAGTGEVTGPTIIGTALVNLPTVSAMSSAVGSINVVINVQPTITGLEASGNIHQVTVIGDAIRRS